MQDNETAAVLEKLYREVRRNNRWGLAFRFFGFATFIVALAASTKLVRFSFGDHVAVVPINGTIADGYEASAKNVNETLRDAFDDSGTKAVVIEINSPGGSPVQSDDIYREILRLRNKHKKVPVYAVCVDTCASGAYYIASAADNIYANPASVVGSIGVAMDGFGFVGAMQKLGVERRALTAGDRKRALDPFSELKPDDVSHIQGVLGDIHQQFIASVRAGRGARLKESTDIFSGQIWDGRQAMALGLVDGFYSVDDVARDIIKIDKTSTFKKQPNPFGVLAQHVTASIMQSISAQVRF